MRSQALASGTPPDATEPVAVVDVVEEDLSHLPSYARPTRASLGHVRRGVRASTGSLPTTHRPGAKPQQHVRSAAADATTDVVRRGSSRRSTAGDTALHALESIYEVPAAASKAPEAVPSKRSALSGASTKHAAAAKTSRHNMTDTAVHRDLSTGLGDQSVLSSMSGKSRGSLPGSKYPSRSTGSASTASRPAPAASNCPMSSRAAPVSASGSRPSSAASGQGASSTSTSSSSGSGSRAVSAPARRTNSSDVAGTGPTGGATKGRKSITPRAAQSAAVTSTDFGKGRSAAQPLSKSARCVSTATSADAYLAAPLTAGASAGGAFKGRKVSVGSAAVSSAGAGAAARTNRASMVRASRDSTSSGLQAGAGAAQVARPAKPGPLPTASTSAAPAATSAATAAQGAAAADVGTEALDRVAEADALCAAIAAAANSQSVKTAATTAEPARSAAAAQRSITPDALVPAPGFGTLITPSVIGPTPYGPTPMPPTAFKQGWRPGATPEATPGGLGGHFTALVTPGGACWPQGMPAGGLVPYSITPPEGGRTIARTGAGGHAICGRKPAAMGTGAAGAAARLEQGFAAASASPGDSFAATSEGPREGLRTQSARPYRSVTPPAASAVASRNSSVRRSMTPAEEGIEMGADGPDSSRRSQTPGRTPHSAAKNAALAAQLQNLEQTWGQYKETSGRSSISCSPARARSVPRGSSMRSSIGMPGTRSSLSYSPADISAATIAAAGTNESAAALVAAVAKSPAGKVAGQPTKRLTQLPDIAQMQELKAAAAAAEAAWYASKSGEEEAQGELAACGQSDSPAAAAGSANATGVAKAPGKHPAPPTVAGTDGSSAHLSARKGTVTDSSRPHRYSSGSHATPLSTARPTTRGSAGTPGKTPAAAHVKNSAARLTGTKRQTPSRTAAAAVVTPAADGIAAHAGTADGMASGAKWSATAQWAAPSPSASPSFTAKKASKRTGKTPLRHGSAARATKSPTAAAAASGGAGTAVPFSGFAAAVAEGSPAAASAGPQAGHVVAQFGTSTFGALPAAADVPDSPSNIDVSGDIEEVAERLADFSIQQYELQRVTSPDAAVGGTGVQTPLESSRQGLNSGPSAVLASWMAFAAGAPGSTSSAGRVKTPPRFRLSGVGVAAGFDGSRSSHGRGTGGVPTGCGTQAVTPNSATAAAGSSGGSKVQRSIPKAPVAVATTVAAAVAAASADVGSSRGGSGATTPTGSESEFYSPLQCTPGSSKSQSHASRLAAEEAAAAAEPNSVERLSRKYAALSLIPKAPGTAAAAAGAPAVPVPGPGDTFFTPVEGLVQGAASPGFSSARRQGLASATAATTTAAAAGAGDDVAVSSASKRRRVAAAAAAAVAAAFGGSQADAEAAAAAAAAVVATAQASGGSVGAVGASSQPAKVSKQLLDLFDTAATEASVTPPSVPAAAAVAGAVARGASSTPGSAGSAGTGSGSAPRPMRRLSSGAMRTPIVPLVNSPATATSVTAAGAGASKTPGVSACVGAPAGVAASRKTPAAAGATKALPAATGVPAAEHATLGARAVFFDVPEVGTPLFPPHTPAATPLKNGFGALSARKLAHIGSGARRVTAAAPASRRKQQQWEVQEAETAQAPAPAAAVSGAAAAAAAAAALHSRIGKGPAVVQTSSAARRDGAGDYSIPASASRPVTRRYAAALTPPAAAPSAAAAASGSPEAETPADAAAAAIARYNRAGAVAAAAAASDQPGSGPNGPTDTLAAAAAAAAAGFDVGFRPSPTFKVQSKFPTPAATATPPPAGATGTVSAAAAGTPGSAGFGSSGIGSPSFATTESDTASTEQGRSGTGGSALKSTAKSGRSANKMFSGGLTKARQLLKAALPKGSSSKASTKQGAAGSGKVSTPAVATTGGAAGDGHGAWEVTGTYALSQQQSFDDARGPGYDDQTRDVPSSGPFRSAGVSKGQVPAAAAAAGGPGRVRSPPEGAGAGGMLGAWDAADMALPIEAMSDTAYVTTRRRH